MSMSQRWVMLCSLALVVVLTASAAAQQRRGGFGFGFGRGQQSLVSLAAQEPVQKDLGLSADAAGKLNGLNDEYRAAIQKEMQAAGQLDFQGAPSGAPRPSLSGSGSSAGVNCSETELMQ